jgi:hypothetical protein
MRLRKRASVNSRPDLVLNEAAGDERLAPEGFRRRAVFRQQLRQHDRGIEINQRSPRSCSSSLCSSRKGAIGRRGGGVDALRAGGVIQPLRTASASKASASTGLLVSGGTISATTRSRSVTSTLSPCSARRTYSLSLFFSTFKPTAFTRTNVAPCSYLCQTAARDPNRTKFHLPPISVAGSALRFRRTCRRGRTKSSSKCSRNSKVRS